MSAVILPAVSFFELQRRFVRDGQQAFIDLHAAHGDRFSADVPLLPRVFFFFRPDHNHDVLVTHAAHVEKPELLANVLRSSFGNGLFSSNGDGWKRQRRLMQPTFHHAKIAQFARMITDHTARHIDHWKTGDIHDIGKEMHALTFTIVVDALFSADARGITGQVNDSMHDLGQAVAAQGANLLLALAPEWLPVPVMQRKRRGVAAMNAIIYPMIAERRAAGEANSPHDLLSVMLFSKDVETGETMSDQQLRDEIMTLFIAGHETTAATLSWAWALLSQHTDTRARLISEVRGVLGDRTPTLDDLKHMPFLRAVIDETLRLYPPAWFIMRQTTQALRIDGVDVPKGSIIFSMPYVTQRDPRWFPDPAAFKPERWESETVDLPKGAYFPFGMGPRICIGNGFAHMEASLILAQMISRFAIDLLDEPIAFKGTGVMNFANSVRGKITAS